MPDPIGAGAGDLTPALDSVIRRQARALMRRHGRIVHYARFEEHDLVSAGRQRVLEYMPCFDSRRASLRTYVALHAWGGAYDFLRSQVFRGRTYGGKPSGKLVEYEPGLWGAREEPTESHHLDGWAYQAWRQTEQARQRDAVHYAIRQLTPREQSIVYLMYWEGRNGRQIAAIYGVDPTRISQILRVARAKLADHMRVFNELTKEMLS